MDMMKAQCDLVRLGWGPFFQQQLSIEEWEEALPARVAGLNRHILGLVTENGPVQAAVPGSWYTGGPEDVPTVGDWLLLDRRTSQPVRLLERKSFLHRRAAGREAKIQALAANIDTLFIVTSCNDDFNPSRIERYLTLAMGSGVTPVLVITKADLVADADEFIGRAKAIRQDLDVCVLNALDAGSAAVLENWCGKGQTLALAGSSGVGKSTLVNTLQGEHIQSTGAIREHDARGRHTTTGRSLHMLPSGAVLIDTPGIRELQLADVGQGLASAFDDIEQLAAGCRFNDCTHDHESGCAVQAAVLSGELELRRLENYRKIRAEQQHNALSVAEKRNKARKFGKMCRNAVAMQRKKRLR